MQEATLQPTTNAQQTITVTVAPGVPLGDSESSSNDGNDESVVENKDGLAADAVSNKKNDLIPKIPYQSDPLFFEVANFFGLKQEDYDSAKNKLSDIVEYVIREIDSNKVEDIIPRLREIEDSIQSSGWDERRYTNMHKYIRLADKKATIGKMMKAYEKRK